MPAQQAAHKLCCLPSSAVNFDSVSNVGFPPVTSAYPVFLLPTSLSPVSALER